MKYARLRREEAGLTFDPKIFSRLLEKIMAPVLMFGCLRTGDPLNRIFSIAREFPIFPRTFRTVNSSSEHVPPVQVTCLEDLKADRERSPINRQT